MQSNAVQEEIGDVLFAVVNRARLTGVHPTTALARANAKFMDRFRELETRARSAGADLPTAGLTRLDQLWNEVKAGEAAGAQGPEPP